MVLIFKVIDGEVWWCFVVFFRRGNYLVGWCDDVRIFGKVDVVLIVI